MVVRCTPRVRAKFHAARALARRVAGEALPIWACMEAVTAEALSALPVGAALEGDESECAFDGEAGASWAERRADRRCEWPRLLGEPEATGVASAPMRQTMRCGPDSGRRVRGPRVRAGMDRVAPLLADLESADAFELDARLRRAVAG